MLAGWFTVVTDSGSNMSGSCGFRSQYDWIACADHKIATVLTTILCKTTETVDKVRSETFYKFRRDAPQVFDLIDACKTLVRYVKQANLQHELSKTLKQENITRWGSQFRMMSSVLEMFDELAEMLTARQRLSYLQSDDRSLLDELVRFLAHFQESTLKVECWRKPTLHLVAFEKYRLVELLKPQRESLVLPADDDGQAETIPPDSESLIVVKQLILTHSLPKWNVTEKHIVAAMLDPRQKNRLHLFGVEDSVINNARNVLRALMREYTDRSTTLSATVPSAPAKRRRKKPRSLPSLDDFEEEKVEAPSNTSPEQHELNKFWLLN